MKNGRHQLKTFLLIAVWRVVEVFGKEHSFIMFFPENILNQNLHITALVVLSIILCLRLWGQFFKGLRIVLFCDNMAACQIINSGKSRFQILQDFLREKKGSERREMGSTFHLLCPGYSEPLTPNRQWEIFIYACNTKFV